ncbi:hypothetical protein V8B97DRAFT_1867968 [Scleroderma yunnanense]
MAPASSRDSSGGLLFNVFSFVSREIESFVVNATGGQTNNTVSGPTKPSRRRKKRLERGARETNPGEDDTHRNLRRCRSSERTRTDPGSRPKSRSKSTDASRRRKLHRSKPIVPPAYVDTGDADAELSASDADSPSPSQPTLKKKPSITMPGSLFPRSSSLEPADTPASRLAGPSNGASHAAQSHRNQTNPSSLDAFVSPWRTRPISSVHDAVQRFNVTDGEEADFSLRLPTPHSSPDKLCCSANLLSDDANVSFLRLPLPDITPAKPTSSSKGKERMQDDDLLYIFDGPNDDAQIQAKERELVAAREEQHQRQRLSSSDASDERKRDKERIQMLEEEVKRLREELSRSQHCSLAPPPPPPPPPPPIPPPLPIHIDASSDQSTLFAGARAALRHTSPPREAPLNPVGTKRQRQGQPTVNVPTEKMAAFLNEIKTVRLRKVGTGTGTEGGAGVTAELPLSQSSNLSKSTSALSWASGPIRPEISRRRSLVNLGRTGTSSAKETLIKAGQKRKADAMGIDELIMSHASKRRLTEMSTGGSSSSGSSSSQPASTSRVVQDSSKKTWSSLSTNETDITTPSLCSDNDRDGDGSLEDQTPPTPPGPRSTLPERRSGVRQPEIIDADLEAEVVGGNTRSRLLSSGSPRRTFDMFEKRPPMSPIPHPTPRKPTAPARARRVSTPKPKYVPPDSDSDNNGGNRADTPFLSLIPVAQNKTASSGRGRPPPRAQNESSSRRSSKNDHRTLDEELRSAGADMASGDDLLVDDDSVFVGIGTRSKRRGFLAHGGAGGPPVHMGVGYVRGAQASDGEVDSMPRKVVHKSASQGSLIPRLA